jgi:hypothetical protein
MLDRWLMTHGDGWHRRASLGTAVYINKVGFCRLIVATIVGRLGNGRVVHARLGVGGIFFFPFLFFVLFVCLGDVRLAFFVDTMTEQMTSHMIVKKKTTDL